MWDFVVYEFYAGSYAAEDEEGIVKFWMDTEAGTISKVYGYQGIPSPSYITLDSEGTMLYAVQEQSPEGAVCALQTCSAGLELLKILPTGGADPCHVCRDRTKGVMMVSNYSSGSLAVYGLDGQGIPVSLNQMVTHEGGSIHPNRQKGPHVHCSRVCGNTVFTADLGLDQVFVYEIDGKGGRLADTGARLRLPAGAGPRHLDFHGTLPGIIYVVCELSSQIAVFSAEAGHYRLIQLISTVPEEYRGTNTASAVKVRGRLLFAGNRGHDSVAVYRIQEDGALALCRIVSSGGKTPRDFEVFGDHLVVANQDSNLITVLKIDWEAGWLEETGLFAEMIRPSCICGLFG